MEYKEFAKYYDKLYEKKNYKKEVCFLNNFISSKDKVIDIGCGTGIHASLLENRGINVDGLDLNEEMLSIAKKRIHGSLYNQNMLSININKKYDVIISMFAVINHLKDLSELKMVLINLKRILSPNGTIIIDLHNPNSSGEKTDEFDNIKRTMKWHYDNITGIEESTIIFEIDNEKYIDHHTFKIFKINELISCCENINLKVVNIYEDYDISKLGSISSKNLQFIIKHK